MHATELALVVGNQNATERQRTGGDQCIQRADGRAESFQFGANASVDFGRDVVERLYIESGAELGHGLHVSRRVAALMNAVLKFRESYCRDADLAQIMAAEMPQYILALAAKQVDADVCVQ